MNKYVSKLWSNYQNASFGQMFFFSIVVLSIGILGVMIFGYLGVYKSGLKLLTIAGLLLFFAIFILSILSLIHKSKLTWRLFVSFPFIIILAIFTIVFFIMTKEMIEFGWIKCELCP